MSTNTFTIELGECPFCHGKVNVAIREKTDPRDEKYGFRTYRYDTRDGEQLVCEHGCPLGQIRNDPHHTFGSYKGSVSIKEVKEAFVKEWLEDCAILRQREPCSECGNKPEFGKSEKHFPETGMPIHFGCSHCERWVEGFDLVNEVLGWTKRESELNERVGKWRRLIDLLNGLDD